MKIHCEFEIDLNLLNDDGIKETNIKKYNEYITILLSKAYSKALSDFIANSKKENITLFKGVSKQLSKEVDDIKLIIENLKFIENDN